MNNVNNIRRDQSKQVSTRWSTVLSLSLQWGVPWIDNIFVLSSKEATTSNSTCSNATQIDFIFVISIKESPSCTSLMWLSRVLSNNPFLSLPGQGGEPGIFGLICLFSLTLPVNYSGSLMPRLTDVSKKWTILNTFESVSVRNERQVIVWKYKNFRWNLPRPKRRSSRWRRSWTPSSPTWSRARRRSAWWQSLKSYFLRHWRPWKISQSVFPCKSNFAGNTRAGKRKS